MSKLSVVVFSILGFVLPVILALIVVPSIFPSTPNAIEHARARLAHDGKLAGDSSVWVPMSPDPGSKYISIPSDPSLDPVPTGGFVVSVLLQIEKLPAVGKRKKVVYKYAGKTKPYPGWALAMHRFSSSVRPEVYWQGESGKGGWHTFDDVEIEQGKWYTLTLLALPGEFLNLYVEEVKSPLGRNEGEKATVAVPQQGTVFAGGFQVSDVAWPHTTSNLYIRSNNDAPGTFETNVAGVVIGRLNKLPKTIDEAKLVVSGGLDGVAALIGKDSLGLWIDETGRDKSLRERVLPTPASV